MAYNLYSGPTGRVRRVEEERRPERPASPLPPQREPVRDREAKTPPEPLRDVRRGLDGVLKRLDPKKLETEDLLVLAILWLLYRESGETEMLIALGAYLFL